MDIKILKQEIGPGLATQLLKNNTINRPVSRANLKRIVMAMRDGEWQEDTGETLKFDKEGNILDGQHRLMAIVESGKSYEFMIIEGLNKSVFDVIDTGKMRSASDSLHILGVKSVVTVSGIIRRYMYLESGKIYNKSNEAALSSNTKVVNEYQKQPKEWERVTQKASVLNKQSNRLLSKPFIGAWYKYLYDNEPDECEVFFHKLMLGLGLTDQDDPIFLLRNMLLVNKNSDTKLTQFALNAYFIVTWNSSLQGIKYEKMPWKYGDEVPKVFRTKETAMRVANGNKEPK